MHPRRPPCRSSAGRRLRGLLVGLLACWLLTQALGHAHALLHLRRDGATPAAAVRADAAAGTAAAAGKGIAAALVRAFHPRGEAAVGDDGICRLCAQLAQGDLALHAAPAVAPGDRQADRLSVPAATAAAGAAPRRAAQARGPPDAG